MTDSTPEQPPTPDLAAVKQRQRTTWSTGDFSRIAVQIHAAAEQLVQNVDLQAGWRVLDVATGSGNAAIAAARAGCLTTGVDYVPELLEAGRRRAAVEHLEIDFREGDAEELPFADATFDAVISIYGVMFAPDHRRAAAELLRVTRPGGRIALGCWTPESSVGDMFRTVTKHAPPPPGLQPPGLWGTEEHVRELFGDGVSELRTERRTFVFRYRSAAEYVETFRTWFGPVMKAFEFVGPEGAAALERDLLDLIERWNRNPTPTPVAMPSDWLEIVATRR